MNVIIRPSKIEDLVSFHAYIDAVAKERLYFALTAAPPLPDTAKFLTECVLEGDRQFFAIDQNTGKVVGGADWHPEEHEGFKHSCNLGMGLLPAYRGQGLGVKLMQEVIAGARRKGFERMQLSTYSHNTKAIALYKKMGFEEEGRERKARFLDGIYSDTVLMALFL